MPVVGVDYVRLELADEKVHKPYAGLSEEDGLFEQLFPVRINTRVQVASTEGINDYAVLLPLSDFYFNFPTLKENPERGKLLTELPSVVRREDHDLVSKFN